jgi:hypothetical protein
MRFMPNKPSNSILNLIGRRLPWNATGLQNAHIIGVSFYNEDQLDWLASLLQDVNADVNFVVLPESERGSAILGVAAHFGFQNKAFDRFFFENEEGIVDEDLDPNPSKFLNRLKRHKDRETKTENELKKDLYNFLDYVKVMFLYEEILKARGYQDGDTPFSLGFNIADPRFAATNDVETYYEGTRPNNSLIFERLFDDSFVRTRLIYTTIETARNAGHNIDNAWLVYTFPELSRMLYPSEDGTDTGNNGQIVWATGDRAKFQPIQADILSREAVFNTVT